MDHAHGMRGVKPRGYLSGDLDNFAKRHRPAAEARLKGFARHICHGDEWLPVPIADFVDGGDVWMVQGAGGLRFTQETCLRVRAA